MSEQGLPDKIVRIDILRINRNQEKFCNCQSSRYIIDTKNHVVSCDTCGATVDPFFALLDIAEHNERYAAQVEQLLEQRRQIENYKPWLVVIKKLEERYRGGEMVPTCPRCHEAFDLKELLGVAWANRRFLKPREGGDKRADD